MLRITEVPPLREDVGDKEPKDEHPWASTLRTIEGTSLEALKARNEAFIKKLKAEQ